MDKLKRVLSGNDDAANEENRGIMGDVCAIFIGKEFRITFIFTISFDIVLMFTVLIMKTIQVNGYLKG